MKRIATAFSEPFMVGELSIDVSASVGMSFYPADATDAESLVRNADAAMYRAKELGRLHRTGRTMRHGPLTETTSGPLDEPTLLTVEAAAGMMHLSRPHVLKLIFEQRFNNVLGKDGGILLIPQSEVCRVWSQISGYQECI